MIKTFHGSLWVAVLWLLLLGTAWGMPRQGAPLVIWGGDPSQRNVALTFDDGPCPNYTLKILALLREYKVHATFFVTGDHLEKYPWLVRAVLRDGNEVGNHSFSHPRLTQEDQPCRERELERTAVGLDLAGCPENSRLFRPPYSAYDERLKSYLANTGRHLVLWNIDSGDWQGLDAVTIARNVLTRIRNGAIIVFHDSDETGRANRKPTVAALRIILPALKAMGYRMVTISELFSHPH